MIEPAKVIEALAEYLRRGDYGRGEGDSGGEVYFAPSAAIFAASQKVDSSHKGREHVWADGGCISRRRTTLSSSSLGGVKPDVDVKALAGIEGKEDAIEALAASFAFSHKALATLTAQNAFASVRDDMTKSERGGVWLVAHSATTMGRWWSICG